jgi:peptidoglycan/xylan/chitin deacetylase (PgdA/CDA1 family)
MIPHRIPFFLPLLYPGLIWRMNPLEKNLYLTFDDGPVPGPTESVLDMLSQASIKATFFSTGDNIRKHPRIFSRIISDGHGVGNHTVNHVNGWKMSTEKYIDNVKAFDAIARESGYGQAVKLFRPPYGRISRKQIEGLRDYRIIMWDVLSQDYDRRLSPEKCLRRTLAACRPGSIIVFHDSYKSQRNMEFVLPRLIDHLSSIGYGFKPILP